MHPTIPTTIANASTLRKIEIQSSEANQLCLKFVVSYREAAKRKQKLGPPMYSLILFAIATDQWITQFRLISTIVGVCAVVLILHAIKTVKDRRDSKRIYEVLRRLTQDGQYTFRSSQAISEVTNLPVSRISVLCGKHPQIERKAHERQTWRVVN